MLTFSTAPNAIDLADEYNQNGANDRDSVSSFINALFDKENGSIRNPATMTNGMLAAAQNSDDGYWLISEQAQQIITGSWLHIWMNKLYHDGDTDNLDARLVATDMALFAAIADYVQANSLSMFVPRLTYRRAVSPTNQTPVYTIAGYERFDLFLTPGELAVDELAVDEQAQSAFLKAGHILYFFHLLATGAHFVSISSPRDYDFSGGLVRNSVPFWTLFQSSSLIKWRDAGVLTPYTGTGYMHSHYSAVKGVSNVGASYAYPNTITSTGTPTLCPFVCSLLVGTTSRAEANTFFQLEGWPGTAARGFGALGAHAQDYAVHQATKWNISTYGASPFSEKRGTTVFLAPADWRPDLYSVIWPRYQGTRTLQGWYEGDLIRADPALL